MEARLRKLTLLSMFLRMKAANNTLIVAIRKRLRLMTFRVFSTPGVTSEQMT